MSGRYQVSDYRDCCRPNLAARFRRDSGKLKSSLTPNEVNAGLKYALGQILKLYGMSAKVKVYSKAAGTG